ncbi:MAG: multidrug transporter permease [Variovorax sp.]|nr:multidrug transporter permease [Variovorax sp.]
MFPNSFPDSLRRRAMPSSTSDTNHDAEPDHREHENDAHSGDDKGDGKRSGDKQGQGGEKQPKKPSPLDNPKVRIGLIVGGIVVLIALAVWFTRYWTRGRYEQETNDAYLQADQVAIAPKVPGYVEQVLVTDNQPVQAGDALVKIDDHDVRARQDQARAQIEQGVAQVQQIDAQVRQQRAQIALADAQLSGALQTARHAQNEVDRYAALVADGAQTAEQLESMRQSRDQALTQVASARAQRESASRQLDTLRAQVGVARAQIDQAKAQNDQAEADLGSTVVRSSIAGRIGDRTVRVGQYVQPGTRMMSVVPVEQIYLVANFKETQVGLMRAGQPASIEVDALKGETLHGTVESFAPGTGAQFALLPPQNATGNFTKVVQRVPVRIKLDEDAEASKVLVPGLSVTVTVDTIGSKPERAAVKREGKQQENVREAQHDEEVKRNAAQPSPGPGR